MALLSQNRNLSKECVLRVSFKVIACVESVACRNKILKWQLGLQITNRCIIWVLCYFGSIVINIYMSGVHNGYHVGEGDN